MSQLLIFQRMHGISIEKKNTCKLRVLNLTKRCIQIRLHLLSGFKAHISHIYHIYLCGKVSRPRILALTHITNKLHTKYLIILEYHGLFYQIKCHNTTKN